MKIPFKQRTSFIIGFLAAFVLLFTIDFVTERCSSDKDSDSGDVVVNSDLLDAEGINESSDSLYGICIDSLIVEQHVVESGESFTRMLEKYGVPATVYNQLIEQSKGVFDLRSIRADNPYVILKDSLDRARYFVYEISKVDYVIYGLCDSLTVEKRQKEITIRHRVATATIESSLWNAMIAQHLSPSLAMRLSDIFQWSVDFYSIQKGDAFKVAFDEVYVDSTLIGTSTIYGAWFKNEGKKHYAIRYSYEDKGNTVTAYWDERGKSLKSMFLKAPLKFTRVSSRFSNSRLHPVYHVRRPHHGVDYAAPTGTPVRAIANGTVIHKRYSGGAGNYIKLKHSNSYKSGYMHLSRYAKGLRMGKRVQQGDIIGYVGATGTATGPHLDFRIWHGGKALNPLKLKNAKGPDIAKRLKPSYMAVCDSMLTILN
jgi:murein DD-endopeptidase MepM/ murein hydrolase activator NlpD